MSNATTKQHASPLAHSYARAALELAGDAAEAVGGELSGIAELVAANPNFRQFLTDPSVVAEERRSLIHRVLGGRAVAANGMVLNLLGVMGDKHRLSMLGEVAVAYRQQLDARNGVIDVEVTTAAPLDAAALAAVTQSVSAALGRSARVQPSVDASLIGGLVLKIDDKVIDGSVRAQLSQIRHRLLAAKPVKSAV